jgi:hypothetical protein
MNMVGIHMMEDMCMVEKHPSNVEGMNTEEERLSKKRPEVKSMDMVEDMMTEVVEKEHKDMVLARHWIEDGAERHQ